MKKHTFFKHWLLMLPLLVFSFSCKKDAKAVAPTNLNLVATVSTDGSGRVDFVATATNADRYFLHLAVEAMKALGLPMEKLPIFIQREEHIQLK